MPMVNLNKNTLAVLVAGMYCTDRVVNAMAIPESIWIEIAEKLEYFLPMWDYDKISFEDWIKNCLFIYPKQMIDSEDLKEIQEIPLYWERIVGNVTLIVSMDISLINNVEEVSE